MKASLMRNPLLGPGARLARHIRNDSAYGMIHCAVHDLREGGQLVLFPEGTRTTQRPINPFHGSFALITKRAQAPIQAVFIDTDSPYLGKGWPLWRLPPLPIRFKSAWGGVSSRRPTTTRCAPRSRPTLPPACTCRTMKLSEPAPCSTLPGRPKAGCAPGPRRGSFVTHGGSERSERGGSSTPPGRPKAGCAPSGGSERSERGGSSTHLVLIPSYNTGPLVNATVAAARAQWNPVWVVDGSTDGSALGLQQMAARDAGLRVWLLPHNRGKGAAVLHGLTQAAAAGYSHALTMDADGQHPAELIPAFMRASQQRPEAMVLGRPVFDASAPLLRVRGRRISNCWTDLETLGAGVADSLYGFRVYPVAALVAVMRRQPWMRRFDLDTEAVVRLAWRGFKPVNVDAPVRYLSAEEGDVSHCRYGRDNLLLTWVHTRLMLEFVLRLPGLLWRKATQRPPFQA